MRWVIVTGDTGRLGACIVETILKLPEYRVIGLSRGSTPWTQQMEEASAGRYIRFACDLSDPDRLETFFKSSIQPLGAVYGLVNNSAHAYDDIVTNANLEELKTMFNVNVFSPMMLTKLCIRNMLLHRTAGSIVHITSVSASTGYKGLSMYAATKGALESFSKGVAREWGGWGIRSNCIAPGFMDTAMTASLSGELKEKIYSRTSLKKETDPYCVAESVSFLLQDRSNSVTGTVIHADNGSL
ncbi:SDR family NAD(P)-dependent oxidoreductase [Paenibacillus xylaniclasticus]|uniref:SDR family NAD(P)-dependent oxidoreductase n=1 Tax=Paenibacillus xylaniclasticus TaxID=588083 RepID=UPI000FD7E82B|nr:MULTISPECIES: SDR family oxidoreductase [Paenibacillus]GFN32202.1 3-oxoacyl-ACP reductase [Paenibacillus curdlanolyticus]